MPKKQRSEEQADIPISSMIDIVFLLIIFFVVTAVMDKETQDENVWQAMAFYGKPLKKKDPRSVTINVREDGKINFAGTFVDAATVTNILKGTAQEYGNDIPIIIRGDRLTKHKYIRKVMDAIVATQLYKVKFQTTKFETKPKNPRKPY